MKEMDKKFNIMTEEDLALTEGRLHCHYFHSNSLGCIRSSFLYVWALSRK